MDAGIEFIRVLEIDSNGCYFSSCGFYDQLLSSFGYVFPGINFVTYLLLYIKIMFFKFSMGKLSTKTRIKKRDIGLVGFIVI